MGLYLNSAACSQKRNVAKECFFLDSGLVHMQREKKMTIRSKRHS